MRCQYLLYLAMYKERLWLVSFATNYTAIRTKQHFTLSSMVCRTHDLTRQTCGSVLLLTLPQPFLRPSCRLYFLNTGFLFFLKLEYQHLGIVCSSHSDCKHATRFVFLRRALFRNYLSLSLSPRRERTVCCTLYNSTFQTHVRIVRSRHTFIFESSRKRRSHFADFCRLGPAAAQQ